MTEAEVIELVKRLLIEAAEAFEPAVLEAVRTSTSQISKENAEGSLKLVGELVQMINLAAGTDSRLTKAHPSDLFRNTDAEPETVERDQGSKSGEEPDNGPRKHDPVFDFIALDFIRHRESNGRLASKKDMLSVLQEYDPRATDTSLSPTLHKWRKETKGWIKWPPRSVDRIRLTDNGRAHLKDLHAYAAEKEDEVVAVMRKVIDPDYMFPRLP